MPKAELGQEGIDGSDLDASATTGVADFGRSDVVLAVRCDQRQDGKAFDDGVVGFGTSETLKQFLQDQARRIKRFPRRQACSKTADFWNVARRILAECE